VKLVDGANLYLTNAQGDVVKVTSAAGVKLTRMADATISDVKPGDTVIVRGSTNPDGTITATSIADNGASGAIGPGQTPQTRQAGGGGPPD